MAKERQFGRVFGRQLFDKVRVGVHAKFGVTLGGVAVEYIDTEAFYLLVTEDKMIKATEQSIRDFISGIVECYQSFFNVPA